MPFDVEADAVLNFRYVSQPYGEQVNGSYEPYNQRTYHHVQRHVHGINAMGF